MDPGSIARGRQGKRQLGFPIKEKDYTMRPNRLDARDKSDIGPFVMMTALRVCYVFENNQYLLSAAGRAAGSL